MSLPAPSTLFAAEVQYWRLRPECWRSVLEAACEAGLPGISSYVPWEVHELAPGEFDFDGHTDPRKNVRGFFALVAELGLKLAYRPGPFVCNEMDWGGFPRRLVMGDPEMMVLTAQDEPLPGYQLAKKEGHQPSLLHPAYLAEVRTWLTAVDAVAAPFLAANGGPIVTCNLDNELSYIAKDAMFACDYNACVIGPGGYWPQWLARTYGQPSELPYVGRYSDFDAVPPPRELGDDVQTNLQWYLDWVRCKESLLADYLTAIREMHDEAGLAGVQYYTNLNPHRPEGVPTNFQRYGEAAGGLVGYDFYRKPWLSYSGYSSMARVLKLMNATLPLTWSAEFMGGWWFTDMGNNRVTQSHTECMSLAAMANGCQAISWFMFHDRCAWGDSPVSDMGHRRENHTALRNVMDVVHALPEWDALRPQTDLAIVYYRPAMWHCHLGDPAPCNDGALHQGAPELFGSRAGDAVAEYEGLFRLAQQAGYTAAAVDPDSSDTPFAGHKLVWLPGGTYIDDVTEAKLDAFVMRGGTLVVSGRTPRVNLRGEKIDFLKMTRVTTAGRMVGPFLQIAIGGGSVMMHEKAIAPYEPGEEPPDQVAIVRAALRHAIGAPLVSIQTPPIRYKTWAKGGGMEETHEQAVLVDAILHKGGGAKLLYVVNLHDRATPATVSFRDPSVVRLQEIGGAGQTLSVAGGSAELDIDRKAVRVFRVLG